jgi:alkyl hydroperoxide reductase subunit AhpC
MYDVAYFMASVDSVEDNTKFAKATSVTLQGRGGGPATVVEKKEADFPMLADPTKEVATKYGVLMPNPPGFANRWTVLHRQDRQDRLHREDGETGDVSLKTWYRQTRGTQSSDESPLDV